MSSVEKSFYEYFKEYSTEFGAKRFLFDEERSYTSEDVFSEVIALGNRLFEQGVKQGSFVALRCTRSLDTALLSFALITMGATAVFTDPHQDAEEYIQKMGANIPLTAVITNEGALGGISANGDWKISGEPLKIGYPARKEERKFPIDVDRHAPAVVIFTSGSTGKGKAVMLSQSNLVHHVINVSHAGSYLPSDIFIQTLPLHHVFGLAVIVTALIQKSSVMIPKELSLEYIAECIETYRITRLDGVPSFLLALAEYHKKTAFCSQSLRAGVIAGAPSTKTQFDFIESELGITMLPVYGQSECISISGANDTKSSLVRSSTVGAFLPVNQCVIFSEEGKEVAQGDEGEICVKGPVVMLGYYDDEEGMRSVIDERGWLHTGDLGYLDEEGNLHISNRKKDIIIRNGKNLSAGKIEQALYAISGVSRAVVVGIKHERFGEVPCALVVLSGEHSMTEEDVKRALQNDLVKNEIPEKILFADALPLTSSGKPDKQKIKEMF